MSKRPNQPDYVPSPTEPKRKPMTPRGTVVPPKSKAPPARRAASRHISKAALKKICETTTRHANYMVLALVINDKNEVSLAYQAESFPLNRFDDVAAVLADTLAGELRRAGFEPTSAVPEPSQISDSPSHPDSERVATAADINTLPTSLT